MFGIDALLIFIAVIVSFLAFFAFTNALAGAYEKFAGPIFFDIPLIGETTCQLTEEQSETAQAYIFGQMGSNTPGCITTLFQGVAAAIMVGVIGIQVLSIFFSKIAGPLFGSHFNAITKGGKGLITNAVLLAVILMFPMIHDVAASTITQSAYLIAARPHGVTNDPDQIVRNAETTITTSFHMLTDASLGTHDCLPSQDLDGDGLKETVTYDLACMQSRLLTTDLLQTVMSLIMGGMVKGGVSIMVYGASIVRLIVTGVIAVVFVLMLALTRLPVLGRFFDPIMRSYILMMFCPILIAAVFTVGDILIIHELNALHEIHPDETGAEKNVAFILALGVPFSVLAIITLCMQFFAPAMLTMGMMVMAGLSQAFQGATKLATSGASTAVGGATGSAMSGVSGSLMHMQGMPGASGNMYNMGGGDEGGGSSEPVMPSNAGSPPPQPEPAEENRDSGRGGGGIG